MAEDVPRLLICAGCSLSGVSDLLIVFMLEKAVDENGRIVEVTKEFLPCQVNILAPTCSSGANE